MACIIYTKPGCGFSRAVIELLDRMRIEYEERRIESIEERTRLKKEHNWQSFPIVFINGTLIGGYRDTQELADRGELEDLLKK